MKQHLKKLVPASWASVNALRIENAQLRDEVTRLRQVAEQTNEIVQQINHELHHGGDSGLPLLIDVADRCRTDAATVVATAQALERSVAVAVQRMEAATQHST